MGGPPLGTPVSG